MAGNRNSGNRFGEGMLRNAGNTAPRHLIDIPTSPEDKTPADIEKKTPSAYEAEDQMNSESTYQDWAHKKGAEHISALHAHATNLYNMTGSPFAASAMDSASKALAAHDAYQFNPVGPYPKDKEGNVVGGSQPAIITTSFDHMKDAWNSLKSLKSENMVNGADAGVSRTITHAGDAIMNYQNMYSPAQTVHYKEGKVPGRSSVTVDNLFKRNVNVDTATPKTRVTTGEIYRKGEGEEVTVIPAGTEMPKGELSADAKYQRTAKYEDQRKASGNKKRRMPAIKEVK